MIFAVLGHVYSDMLAGVWLDILEHLKFKANNNNNDNTNNFIRDVSQSRYRAMKSLRKKVVIFWEIRIAYTFQLCPCGVVSFLEFPCLPRQEVLFRDNSYLLYRLNLICHLWISIAYRVFRYVFLARTSVSYKPNAVICIRSMSSGSTQPMIAVMCL